MLRRLLIYTYVMFMCLLIYTYVTEYGEAFQMFDKDGDGRITRDELAAMMAKFGEEVSDEELNNIMASTDTNST